MKWEKYNDLFTKKAITSGFTHDEICDFLNYAKILFDKKIPIIYDQRHLSLLVGYNEEYLYKVTNSQKSFYRTFKIQKRSGGVRKISEPLPSLKEIQRWILDEILSKCRVSAYAKAYRPNKSVKDNAIFHLNQSIILTLDIRDFFSSLKWKSVFKLFCDIGYSIPVSMMLSKICCLNDSLPQGAPTSPTISNILMNNVDKRISAFTKSKNIHYTRYADDMTFSGDFIPGMVIKFVSNVLKDHNLDINKKKIRVRKKNQRQEVTGIIVNNEEMRVIKEKRKKIRQSLYYIQKYGLSSHLQKIHNNRANYIRHLLGIINFMLFINPKDDEVKNYKRILMEFLPNQDKIN